MAPHNINSKQLIILQGRHGKKQEAYNKESYQLCQNSQLRDTIPLRL